MCARTDLQMVNISLRVLSKPDTEELSNIYKASALLSPSVWIMLCPLVVMPTR